MRALNKKTRDKKRAVTGAEESFLIESRLLTSERFRPPNVFLSGMDVMDGGMVQALILVLHSCYGPVGPLGVSH